LTVLSLTLWGRIIDSREVVEEAMNFDFSSSVLRTPPPKEDIKHVAVSTFLTTSVQFVIRTHTTGHGKGKGRNSLNL
jgi:hypothetical protein